MCRKHPLSKAVTLLCFIALTQGSFDAYGQKVESFGLFMGMNFPFTLDVGLHKDPRYFGQFTLRASPVGFSYGYDHVGYGYLITPSFVKIGQKYAIRNTSGGEVGTRDIQMNYFSLPMALKLHLNDLAFFRLSVVASVNFDYLLSGKEVISHEAAKLKYPPGVTVPSDPGFNKVYDGVFVPEIASQVYVSKDKYKAFQISAGVGFHSDFDFNEDWSMSIDGRAVFGIFDPRKDSYLTTLKGPGDTPDLFGQRREVYLGATIGICRIIQIKETFRPKSTSKSGNSSNQKGKGRKPKR